MVGAQAKGQAGLATGFCSSPLCTQSLERLAILEWARST